MDTLMVVGGTGDLAGRFLLPAVARLRAAGAVASDLQVVGAGHETLSTDEYRGHVRDRLTAHAPDVTVEQRDAFVASVRYHAVDVTDPVSVGAAVDAARAGSGTLTVYLALPTALMLGAVRALAGCDLPAGSRVAVEKPMGRDLASAVELNAALRALDGSDDAQSVYRVDHALGMHLLDTLSEPRLPVPGGPVERTGERIEQVDVLWEETLALEGRAAFYDGAGALRDVMQNHQLQLLTALAQPQRPENDATDDGDATRRRIAVLRTVRPLTPETVRTQTRRARYTAGRLVGDDHVESADVPDYRDEPGVDPERRTETFAEVVLELDSPQWAGTRFVLRAGKALDGDRRGVVVHLRPDPGSGAPPPEPVWFDVDRADAHRRADAETVAYRRVVQDLLAGGSTYAVGAEEAELAWQVFQPVLDGWADEVVPLQDYPAGSAGPE